MDEFDIRDNHEIHDNHDTLRTRHDDPPRTDQDARRRLSCIALHSNRLRVRVTRDHLPSITCDDDNSST